MKRLISTLLVAGAFALTACSPTMYSSSSSKSKLEGKGYTVEVYSFEEAKARITGLNYEGFDFTDALVADKGADDERDVLLAFYFKNVDDASKFIEENIGQMNRYAENTLGSNLTVRVGSHNNVAYTGSETSFANGF